MRYFGTESSSFASIPKVVGSNPTAWPGIFFKPARCGIHRVTSHKHLIHLSTLHQHSKFHDFYSLVFNCRVQPIAKPFHILVDTYHTDPVSTHVCVS